MIYLKLAYDIISVICIVFFILHPKVVLSFWWMSIKKVTVGIYKMIKGWVKK